MKKIIYFYKPYVSRKELKLLTDPVTPKNDQPIPLSSLHQEMIKRLITKDDENDCYEEERMKKSKCWTYLTNLITDNQDGIVFKKLMKTVKKYQKRVAQQGLFGKKRGSSNTRKPSANARFPRRMLSKHKIKGGGGDLQNPTQNQSPITPLMQEILKTQPTLGKSRTVRGSIAITVQAFEPEAITASRKLFGKKRTKLLNIKIDPLVQPFKKEERSDNNRSGRGKRFSQLELNSIKSSKITSTESNKSSSNSSSMDKRSEISNFDDDLKQDTENNNLSFLSFGQIFKKQVTKKHQQQYINKNLSFNSKESDSEPSHKNKSKSPKERRPAKRGSDLFGQVAKRKMQKILGFPSSSNYDIQEILSPKKEAIVTTFLQQKLFNGIQQKIETEKFNEDLTKNEPQNRLKSFQQHKYEMLSLNLSPSRIILPQSKRKSIIQIRATRNSSLKNLISQNKKRPQSSQLFEREREAMNYSQIKKEREINNKTKQFLQSVEDNRRQIQQALPTSKDIISPKNIIKEIQRRRPMSGQVSSSNIIRSVLLQSRYLARIANIDQQVEVKKEKKSELAKRELFSQRFNEK
ncbi:UNKNOWN [Stylonychia lemnae]|uniref:Uncharacterized protein n=1 Tax=Stylonychia lemnae TaxID=5949 RepID=A0A078AX60_STYLE|nr:UNKNOWN [Stylonychia lemnae]|eukprot:CDW85837.1 UNKNOWN [Stylonychia lemnae]